MVKYSSRMIMYFSIGSCFVHACCRVYVPTPAAYISVLDNQTISHLSHFHAGHLYVTGLIYPSSVLYYRLQGLYIYMKFSHVCIISQCYQCLHMAHQYKIPCSSLCIQAVCIIHHLALLDVHKLQSQGVFMHFFRVYHGAIIADCMWHCCQEHNTAIKIILTYPVYANLLPGRQDGAIILPVNQHMNHYQLVSSWQQVTS